jgi:hypothetical protein
MSYYSSYSLYIIPPNSDDRDYYHGIMSPKATSAEAEILLSELNFYEA